MPEPNGHPDLDQTEYERATAGKAEKKLTEVERLGIENTYLKMQNLQLQVQNLDNMKMQCVNEMRQLQQDMEEKRRALSEKYGVDIQRTSVAPDGTIRMPPPASSPATTPVAATVKAE